MKRLRRSVLVCLVLGLAVTACTKSDLEPKATKTGFGIMRSLVQEVIKNTPETTSGRTRTVTVVEVVSQTNRIPAQLGVRFGFTYSVTNLPPESQVVWKKIVTHPAIRKSDGSVSRGFTFFEHHVTSSAGTIQTFTGYGFDHPYELATGEWALELWYGSQKLVDHTFEVFNPGKEGSQPESGHVRK